MLVLAVESVISTAVVGSLVACVGHVGHVVNGHADMLDMWSLFDM